MTLLIAAAMLLSLVPVLLVPVPGFVDVPAHMARHHILVMAPFGGPLARHFAVDWTWMANLGVDIPAALLGMVVGGEAATRLVTALIVPLTIAGIVALSRAAHGKVSASAMLALPFALSQPWAYGFLNYCMSIALALLVAAWLVRRRRASPIARIGLAAAALVVCTAHLAGWVVLLLIAAGVELGFWRQGCSRKEGLVRNLPLLVPIVPILLWRSGSRGSGFAFVYENDMVLAKIAAFAGALRGTWSTLDLWLLVAALFAAWLACRSAGRPKLDVRLFLAGALVAVGTLLAPAYLLSAWGTDMRTAPVAMLLLILSIKPAADARRERMIVSIGLALFLVRVTSVTCAWAARSPMLEARLGMLDVVPRGGRLGFLYVPVTCDWWELHPDEKLASYAVTRREAFVNTLFMVDNARLVTIRDPRLQARWTSDSQRVSNPCPATDRTAPPLDRALAAMRQNRFDAIWISGVPRRDLPRVKGYAVARSLPNETMLVRR